ncbi:hypothetical protein O9K51_10230 [Purpureocillium lavendulum]|uniref:Uncharacterized protein n=1 Tax=Purpureocillium lavendulum TaxID=1247861 RepID=A0AB34FDZ0_9HYPO|nr:hypothetical protein O9K51_10230 [Purpureocillium lavendulum]
MMKLLTFVLATSASLAAAAPLLPPTAAAATPFSARDLSSKDPGAIGKALLKAIESGVNDHFPADKVKTMLADSLSKCWVAGLGPPLHGAEGGEASIKCPIVNFA